MMSLVYCVPKLSQIIWQISCTFSSIGEMQEDMVIVLLEGKVDTLKIEIRWKNGNDCFNKMNSA